LVFPGFPGRPKSARQVQASSGLIFDVYVEYDPQNLLLEQARREVLEQQLEAARLRETLERVAGQPLEIVRPPRLTPLGFPLWADRLGTQTTSSESWSDRVSKMVVRLEHAADDEPPRRRELTT
jgi:ATP-dependent Lhr-like helicase